MDIGDETVPLYSLNLMIHIKHSICSLTLTQTFINTSSEQLFCSCKLPLILESTISSLEVIKADGTLLESMIESKYKALNTYQDPLIKDYGEFLSKSDTNLVIAIGLLSPSEKITTRIKIIFELNVNEGKEWFFKLPITSLPSFENSVKMEIKIESSTPIQNYYSNWKVAWAKKKKGKTAIGSANEYLTKYTSLYISYTSEALKLPTSVIQNINGDYLVMLSLVPNIGDDQKLDFIEGTGEYILIIDRSGSMSGNSIDLAKQSANLILKSIPRLSKFNIISFGSEAECMFTQSVFADTKTVNTAITALLLFKADMGGTSIHNAITAAYNTEPAQNYPRTIFLITDGGDYDTASTLNIIRSNRAVCRVYTFGISSVGNNKQFLIDAAKIGDGSAHFINDIKNLTKETMSSLKTCISACISEVAPNCAGDSVPDKKNLTRYYYGERFAQFILMNKLPNENIEITYYDTYKKCDVKLKISNYFNVKGDELFKLWAKYKISELEASNQQEAVKVSLKYQVPSILTECICVTKQESELFKIYTRPRENTNLESKFPVGSRPCSFYGQGNIFAIIKSAEAYYNQVVGDSSESDDESKEDDNEPKGNGDEPKGNDKSNGGNDNKKKGNDKGSLKKESFFFDIINRNKSQGYWAYTDLQILCPDAIKCKQGLVNIDDNIFTTVFMLRYLSLNFSHKKKQFELIEKKAKIWLSKFDNNISFSSEIDEFIKQLTSSS